jgi:tape measure domain-containing protein
MAGRPIDEKIVAMKLDNSDFKQKASETTNIFGKMKTALANVTGVDMNKLSQSLGNVKNNVEKITGVNLGKVTQEFNNIKTAVAGTDMSKLANGADTVASKFSHMSVVAITAIANLTNKVVDMGLQMGKAMIVDPVMDGFREYETKMGAIQTMLSNTEWQGAKLSDVKKALADLNNYADKTVYNFGQMTENIGRFTAAGVNLADSTVAIKGLSNLAAASGSTSDQLNTAMYQMSQALSAGKIGLEDWNSVVNAGMGGKKFQDALIATAKGMGKNTFQANGFRMSLQKGWLTSKVMLATLKQFGEDKSLTAAATSVRTFSAFMDSTKESIGSGWAQTWELIFGDFDVATKRWSGLYAMVGGFVSMVDNARNSMVKKAADAGVFQGIFDIITKGGGAVLSILQAISKGIGKAFSGTNTGLLSALGKGLEWFANALVPSKETLNVITLLFQGLFSIVKVVVVALAFLGKIFVKALLLPLKLIALVLKGIGSFIGFVVNLVASFADAVKKGKDFSSIMGGLKGVFRTIGNAIGNVVKKVMIFGDAVNEAWDILTKGKFTGKGPWGEDSKIVKKLFNIRDAAVKVASGVHQAWDILVKGDYTAKGPWAQDSKVVKKLTAMRTAVKDFVDGTVGAWDLLTKGSYAETGRGLWYEDPTVIDRILKIRQAVQDFVSGVQESWSILTKGKFTGKGPWEEDSKIVDKLFTIREAVLKFAHGIEEAWSIITKGEITKEGPWGAESVIVDRLMRIRRGISDLADSIKNFIPGIKEAWGILSTGDIVSKGPWKAGSTMVNFLKDIRSAAMDLGGALAQTWGILANSDFIKNGPWTKDSVIVNFLFNVKEGLKEVGQGFKDMGGAVSQSWTALTKGAFSGDGPWNKDSKIIGWLKAIHKGFQAVGKYVSSLNFTLQPIADGFKSFFKMIANGWNWVAEKVKVAGQAIADHMPNGNKLLAGGFVAGMAVIAWKVFKVIKDILEAFKNWSEIGSGIKEVLEAAGGALDAFAMQVKAQALVTIAIGVGVLAASLLVMSRIKPAALAYGLGAIAGALGALVGAMYLMTKFDITGTGMKAAIQIVALSIAFSILSGALRNISDMKWDEIARGLVGLAGTMIIFTGALALMSKFGGGKIGASALQMIVLASALRIILSVIKEIAGIKTDTLKTGLTTIGIILLELGAFMKLAGGSKFGIGSTLGMLAVGRAITNITNTIKDIATIDPNNLKVGLKTIALILGEIAIFSILTGKMGLFSTGLGLLAVSVALTALMIPISVLGNMNLKTLGIGLGAIAVALVAIAGASMLATGMIPFGAGLVLVAAGLMMLVTPIAILGAMSWGALLKGFTGLALAILILGGAAALLTPIIPSLVAFGLGIMAVGAGMALAGGAFVLFGMGLATLATLSAGAVTTIVAVLGTLLVGFASLIPTAVDFVVKLVVQIAQAIAANTPAVVDALGKFIVALINGLATWLPPILIAATNFIVKLVDGMATALQNNGQPLIDAVMHLVGEILIVIIEAGVAVINALFGWIPGVKSATSEIGATATQTIRDTFGASEVGNEKGKEFAGGINGTNSVVRTAGTNLALAGKGGAGSVDMTGTGAQKGQSFSQAMAAKAMTAAGAGKTLATGGKTGAAGVDMTGTGSANGQEFVNALAGKSGAASGAGQKVGTSGKTGAGSIDMSSVGLGNGQEFANALAQKTGASHSSGVSLANSGKNGAGSVSMSSTGNWFGQGFANGISSSSGSVWSSAVSLAKKAKSAVEKFFDINSPSRVMMETGGWVGKGFAIGMDDTSKTVADSAVGLASTAKDSLNSFIDGFELPTADNELHFKAVVDYDSLDPSKFGSVAPMKLNTSVTSGIASATTAQNRQNVNNKISRTDDGSSTRSLLNDIKDNISRIDPNKPVYLVVNDKLVAQSVTKKVIDNYDLRYMKAERGLANA